MYTLLCGQNYSKYPVYLKQESLINGCYTSFNVNQKHFTILAGILSIFLLGLVLQSLGTNSDDGLITSQVDRGIVQKSVSISGYLEADNLAELAFPQPARVSAIFVNEGETVEAGQLLVTSGSGVRAAERQKAASLLVQTEAARDSLLNGLTLEERRISSTTVEQARLAYENTILTEEKKVAASLATLYSTDLVARAADPEERNAAPTISGSFGCEDAGSYNLSVYRSGTDSGYSLRYDGLEAGTIPVSFTQPVKFGSCGLSIQFDENTTYKNTEWSVQIPNTNSNGYQQRLRAYELTLEQRESNVQAAKYTYELARDVFSKDTASPRIESIIEANAAVAAAQADIARVDALFADEAVYAPFSGVVATINVSVGEVANGPVVYLITNDEFTLIARIPEIDIAKMKLGQKTIATFDAVSDDSLAGTVNHISLIPTLIDGVSYYEANITLEGNREWLRDGLNADVDIIFAESVDSIRIPSRFLISEAAGFSVLKLIGEEISTTTVSVTLEGNDGFVAITGLNEGDIIVAP